MNPAQPGISVVIPAYNAARWIAGALGSVLNQTWLQNHGAVQIIVVDDGSSDETPRIAHQVMQSSGVDFELHRLDNGGPSRARNHGWKRARSEWIQFLDADDRLHPDKLTVQTGAAFEAPADVAVVYSPWRRVTQDGHSRGPMVAPAVSGDPCCELLAEENFVQIGSCLVRRSWIETVGGFDEDCRVVEDVHFLLRLAMAGGRFLAAPSLEALLCYRQPANGSKYDSREFVDSCQRNAEMVEQHWHAQSAETPRRIQMLVRRYQWAARHYAATDPVKFRATVERLNRICPGFLPSGPPALRLLSRLVGYPRAETVATAYRKLKAVVQGRGVAGDREAGA
jgi:glycosyltransferase involved in cell wall biosynthesis